MVMRAMRRKHFFFLTAMLVFYWSLNTPGMRLDSFHVPAWLTSHLSKSLLRSHLLKEEDLE